MNTFHTLVALHAPRKHADFITYARHIVQQITGNPNFPNPTPPLATITAHIDALEAAHTKTKAHAPGATGARDVELQAVMNDLHTLAGHVQATADANPDKALAIITSAGLGTHPHGVHAKPDIRAHMGPGGIVLLHALAAGKGAAYEWQLSPDAGKTWTPQPSTSHAHASIAGLTIGQSYEFRVRANVGDKIGDWHETVAFLVH